MTNSKIIIFLTLVFGVVFAAARLELDNGNDNLEDALFGPAGFGIFSELFNLFALGDNKTEPEVKFDFSGDTCLIKVGGIEGFDPKSENLRVKVRPDTEDQGAIVTIVYTTTSGDNEQKKTDGRPRLRGAMQFVSESTHVIELPKKCDAHSRSESKFTSTQDGWLLIRIPKTSDPVLNVVRPLSNLESEYSGSGSSLSDPESQPALPVAKPTAAVVHERVTPEGQLKAVVEPQGEVEDEEVLFEEPLPEERAGLANVHIARQLDEWDMRREEF
eukprot:Selendium_serpulae@DN3026_c0_g1_i1.p1